MFCVLVAFDGWHLVLACPSGCLMEKYTCACIFSGDKLCSCRIASKAVAVDANGRVPVAHPWYFGEGRKDKTSKPEDKLS